MCEHAWVYIHLNAMVLLGGHGVIYRIPSFSFMSSAYQLLEASLVSIIIDKKSDTARLDQMSWFVSQKFTSGIDF